MSKINSKTARMNRSSVIRALQNKGDLVGQWTPNRTLVAVAAKIYGLALPNETLSRQQCREYLQIIAHQILPGPVKKQPAKKVAVKTSPKDQVREFYASYEWRKLRLTILQRDGRRCLCCGATPEHGIVLHVDHVKPLRFNWGLRLDPDNLQVLCEICNHGKGNWDTTDWRAEG